MTTLTYYTAISGEQWTSRHYFTYNGVDVDRLERCRPGGKPEYRFTLPSGERLTVPSQREARAEIDAATLGL